MPGFALAYLWAGPPRLRKRIGQLLLSGLGIIAGAGWWLLIAELVPAADRPYFGGSTNNNILQLAIGYNGLGRLDGSETGSIGGGGGGGGGAGAGSAFGGSTGITRLFASEFGGQISWLLPAALIALAAMVWVSRRAIRTGPDPRGGPAVGRLADRHRPDVQLHERHHPPVLHGGAGARDRGAGRHRGRWPLGSGAGLAGAAGGVGRRGGDRGVGVRPARPDAWPGFPWLRWAIVVVAGLAVLGILAGPRLARLGRGRAGRLGRWGGWGWPECRSCWPWWPGWPGPPLMRPRPWRPRTPGRFRVPDRLRRAAWAAWAARPVEAAGPVGVASVLVRPVRLVGLGLLVGLARLGLLAGLARGPGRRRRAREWVALARAVVARAARRGPAPGPLRAGPGPEPGRPRAGWPRAGQAVRAG